VFKHHFQQYFSTDHGQATGKLYHSQAAANQVHPFL